MSDQPKAYDGVEGLVPREHSPIGVLSIGLKREVLQDWKREHPTYVLPKNSKGNIEPVMFKGNPEARFFIKIAKGQGPQGSSAMKRYRPMLAGFEPFNLDEGGNPAGRSTFYGFLPAGEITIEGGRVRVPYFKRQRKAAKLGKMVKGRSGWDEFKRVESYNPSPQQVAPSGQAECRGDGHEATRWMPDDKGEWGWRQTECLGDDCPFAAVCKISTQLEIFSQQSAGEIALLRFESSGANTAANIEGFFLRIKRELDTFGMDGELYGLPVRLEVEINIKGAGMVRGKQLPSRRFPVVKIGEQENVAQFRAGLAKMLTEGGGRLALPAARDLVVSPEEEALSLADFTVDPPGKPRVEVVPVDHAANDADVVEAEVVAAEPSSGISTGEKIGIRVKELLGLPENEVAPPGLGPKISKALRDAGLLNQGKAWHTMIGGDWEEIDAVLVEAFGGEAE